MSDCSVITSNKCFHCGGTGWIFEKRTVPEVYGDDTVVEYPRRCPFCNNGINNHTDITKSRANIPSVFYDATLSQFKTDIYIGEDKKILDISNQMNLVNDFVNGFREWEKARRGLYIWSAMRGSGKTFLASCICNELIKKYGITTKYITASELIDIQTGADKNSVEKYEKDPIQLLCDCGLLVLDDIGQKNNNWLDDILFRILNARYNKGLITLFTSNVDIKHLRYDDRNTSRISSCVLPLHLPECNVRDTEQQQKNIQFLKSRKLIS